MVAPASITCPRCGRTSYNRNDIDQRYCGACHQFHEYMDADVLMLYRTIPTEELRRLRSAFELDRAQARQEQRHDADDALTFIADRLTVIDRVLDERGQ